MKKLGWLGIVGVSLVACKSKDVGTSGGSQAGSATAGSSAATPADALTVAVADAASPHGPLMDAGAAFATAISDEGVGPIVASTKPDKIAGLFPGLESETQSQETEDTKADWITLSRGRQTVLKVLIDHMMNSDGVTRVLVDDPMFVTANGLRVGSTGTDFIAKHADATCKLDKFDEEPEKTLFCTARSAPNLTFYFGTKGFKHKLGMVRPVELERLSISEIMWSAPSE